MVNIIKEELSLEESLRKKIEFICEIYGSLWFIFDHNSYIFLYTKKQEHKRLSP